jgi:hypothetical protein
MRHLASVGRWRARRPPLDDPGDGAVTGVVVEGPVTVAGEPPPAPARLRPRWRAALAWCLTWGPEVAVGAGALSEVILLFAGEREPRIAEIGWPVMVLVWIRWEVGWKRSALRAMRARVMRERFRRD